MESIVAIFWSEYWKCAGTGSLRQVLIRDAFHGPALGKMYALIGTSLSIFPVIGPMLGAFIADHFGWPAIFLLLAFFGFFLIAAVTLALKETHHK